MSQAGTSRRSSYVLATSVKDGRVSKTSAVDRHSSDDDGIQKSMLFHKRVYGLLVLQYTTILIISSPLALLPKVQQYLDGSLLHTVLECIAIGGIVSTMIIAVLYGSKYPNSHICLFAITIFVGLEMGLSFTNNIGLYIAIGQATTSFALILAMQQFDFLWFDYPKAVGMSFIAALIWTLILIEQGTYSMMTSFGIGCMGFAFVCIVLCSSYTVEHHVSPEEYVLATLFILCPEALLCVGGAKKRRRDIDDDIFTDEETDLFLNAES
jgi:hypothetical protein